MTPESIRRATYLGRVRKIFSFISLLAGGVLVATGTLACLLLLGNRSALAPLVVEWSDPLPPPGTLLFAQLVANWASLGSLAFAAIVWLLWVFSATKLLRSAGAEGLRNGPFSAVAIHFVPVLAWIMPMLIMTQLEKAARDPAQWRYLANSRLAATSWFVGKMSSATFASGLALQAEAETATQYATSLWFSLFGAMGCLGGLYLFNRFLKHMDVLQSALATETDARPIEETA